MLTLSTLVIQVDVMSVKVGMKLMWTLDLLQGGRHKKKVQYKKQRREERRMRKQATPKRYFRWSQQEQIFFAAW